MIVGFSGCDKVVYMRICPLTILSDLKVSLNPNRQLACLLTLKTAHEGAGLALERSGLFLANQVSGNTISAVLQQKALRVQDRRGVMPRPSCQRGNVHFS